MRPVLDVGEQNYLSLNRRELRERRKQSSPKFGPVEVPNGHVGSFGRKGFLEWNEPLTTYRPQPIE